MNRLIINDVCIVTPEEVILNGAVIIENGIIQDISLSKLSAPLNFTIIEGKGGYLIPGIIDIHTDAIDLEICPRAGADFPIEVAFRELEKRMCGSGITTVFHSIHLGSRMYESSLQSKYSRMQVFENIYAACQKNTLINNKIHLRYEISGTEEYNLCYELVERGYISMFSFMDHTGAENLVGGKLSGYAKRKNLTEEEARKDIEKRMSRPKISRKQIESLTEYLLSKNIPIASHDDSTIAQVEDNYSMGITLCEFPINMETAKRASELGMFSIGGASNVLRGGSNIGNLSVMEAIAENAINVLCSDYYPPSILHSIFLLNEQEVLSLPEASNLASLNPAKACKIDLHKGSIELGKDADLVLVNYSNSLATIACTIVGGNISGQYRLKQTVNAIKEAVAVCINN